MDEATSKNGMTRTVAAKYPGHVWNVDLTTVPIGAGFWVLCRCLPGHFTVDCRAAA